MPLSSKTLASAAEYQITAFEIRDSKDLAASPFSRNSTAARGLVKLDNGNGEWHDVFIKRSQTVLAEFNIYPAVERHFSQANVPRLIAGDWNKGVICYDFIAGKSFLDIRLNHAVIHRHEPSSAFEPCGECLRFQRWVLAIESARCHDVLQVYQRSWDSPAQRENQPLEQIHQYFHHRLHSDSRLNDFYAASDPSFLRGVGQTISLDKFLMLPIHINSRSYNPLRTHLARAQVLLNPGAEHFSAFPVAFGLGDGHGGNTMVTDMEDAAAPQLKYIDYEVAGIHSIILDLAKPIYNDCFFSTLWADLGTDDLSKAETPGWPQIRWQVNKNGIFVKYDLNPGSIDQALAYTKLEHLVRLVFEHFVDIGIGPTLIHEAEDALAHALLCCAILTRNFETRADAFMLNLAIGVRLAVDMREVFESTFRWSNWPTYRTRE